MSNPSNHLAAIAIPMSPKDWLVLEDMFQSADQDAIQQIQTLVIVEDSAEQILLLKRPKRRQARG